MRCDKCELCKVAKSVRLDSIGDINAKIFVVGGRPTLEDDKLNTSFSVSTGSFMNTLLKTAGIANNECYFTYAVKCFAGKGSKPAPEPLIACTSTWLNNELEIGKPQLVLAFGMDAYRAVTDVKGRSKPKDTLHQFTRGDHTFYVLALPAIYSLQQLSSYTLNNTAVSIRKAVSVIRGTGGVFTPDKLKDLKYKTIACITDFDELVARIKETKEVAVDVETRKNDAYAVRDENDKGCPLVSLQFSPAEGEAYFLPWANKEYETPDNPEGYGFKEYIRYHITTELKYLLYDMNNQITLVGHNFKYDAKFLLKYMGIISTIDYDTMLASSFSGEASNGLKKLAWIYTDMGGYEAAQDDYTKSLPKEERWDTYNYPLDILVPYGCADADITLRVYHRQKERNVINNTNETIFKILTRASSVFTDIENDGIKVNREYLKQLDIDLTIEMNKLGEEFRAVASTEIAVLEAQLYKESLGKTGKPRKGKNRTFKMSSNAHINRLFFDLLKMNSLYSSKKTGNPSVGKVALMELSTKHPIALKLLEWRTVAKQHSGFVAAYPDFMDKEDRIHPDYKLVQYFDEESGGSSGTVTGRLSCSEPNLQQVPSRGTGKRIKKLFIPDYPEHVLVDFDYSSIEVRVVAMHCQDAAMMGFFNAGKGDLHRWVASKIYGKPEADVTDMERTYAKSTTFGILYGAAAPKIAQQIGCTVDEASAFMKQYWKLFPNLSLWIMQQKRFVKINKYCESLFGRRRYLPDVESKDQYLVEAALRQGVNAPIQGDASDLTLYSLGRIWEYLNGLKQADPTKPSKLRGSVHDSILASVHNDNVGEVIGHIKYNILEAPELPFIIERGVKLQADVSIGPSWGDQTDIEF